MKTRTLLAAALCAVSAAAAGCGGAKMVPLQDDGDFKVQVEHATGPVVVDFYKGGCPTCLALNGKMDQLADEYKDRVLFTKFELMKPYFAVTSPVLKERFDIYFYPTVILFVNGQEQHRWVIEYNLDSYRRALDEVAGPTTQKAFASSGTGQDNSVR